MHTTQYLNMTMYSNFTVCAVCTMCAEEQLHYDVFTGFAAHTRYRCASCVYDLGVNYVLSVHYVCMRCAFGVHRCISNLKTLH